MLDIPQTLKERISTGKIVPVVCAGVSMSVKNKKGEPVFPSWISLLNNAADRVLSENEKEKAEAIKSMVKIDMLDVAADIAKKTLLGSTWTSFLTEQFAPDLDQLDESSKSLQEAIWKLSKRLITLNYDQCLEWAHENSANINSFDNSNQVQLNNFKNNNSNKNMVWHLHGTINNPDHLVLTPNSYKRLYGDESEKHYLAALTTLKEMMSSRSLLFIGSSLNDIELLTAIHEQNELFSGNTGPHYALVRENHKEEIEAKLGELKKNISILTFSDFGEPLVKAVEDLAKLANIDSEDEKPIKTSEDYTKFDKVSVLLSNPIDKPVEYDYLGKFFKSFKTNVNKSYLSNEYLWEDESDYTFIFSSLTNNGILIEDNSCCSEYLALEDLLDELPINTKGVFIIIDNIPENLDQEKLSELTKLPIAIYQCNKELKQDKRNIDRIYHQIFKKKKLDIFDIRIILNKDKFNLNINQTNINKITINSTKSIKNVDKASTSKFIGRASDLIIISRELTRIEDKTLALSIKGSGGIGKTTIIKKLTVELSHRGKYRDGITFIDCEPINSYARFYQLVSSAFNLASVDDLIEHLQNNFIENNILIIFDNFESILNLDDRHKPTIKKYLDLVGAVSEFCSVIITTRETIEEPWSYELTLRSLESDEALELFNIHTKYQYNSSKQQTFIKTELIEKHLDRNPLAIKLVSSNIPPSKDIYDLERDLFNELKSIDKSTYLNSTSDSNINRQDSLLGSIIYSYNTLNHEEKRAIELISLFPDGISLNNLKEIIKNGKNKLKSSIDITDRNIKSLSNKSLLINSGNDIKLHSIVGRVIISIAKTNEKTHPYWHTVCLYNINFIELVHSLNINNEWIATDLFTSYYNNIITTIETVDKIDFNEIKPEKIFNYIFHIVNFSSTLSLQRDVKSSLSLFRTNLNKLNLTISEEQDIFLDVCEIYLDYSEDKYHSITDLNYRLLKAYPIDDMEFNEEVDFVSFLTRTLAMNIYGSIGYTEKYFKYNIESKFYSFYYPRCFNHTGYFSQDLLGNCDKNIQYFEAKRIFGILDTEELSEHIDKLHPRAHDARCALLYMLHRESPLKIEDVSKIVTTNLSSKAIKKVMVAKIKENNLSLLIESDKNEFESQIDYISEIYESSIKALEQAPYNKLKVIYDYCLFLLKFDRIKSFNFYSNIAIKQSTDLEYPYWIHAFQSLNNASMPIFDKNMIQEPYGIEVTDYIQNVIKHIKKSKRNMPKLG
ncbi:SIR2 family protein [Vibrio fluvialis]|nr:SIR2 family protein [Vibrio fluvialis]